MSINKIKDSFTEEEVKVILYVSFRSSDFSGFSSTFTSNVIFSEEIITQIKNNELPGISWGINTFKRIYAEWSLKPKKKHVVKCYLYFISNSKEEDEEQKEKYFQSTKDLKENDWNLIESSSELK